MDLARAYVHLFAGPDGASPHVAVDLLGVLRARGHAASLRKVSHAPHPVYEIAIGAETVQVRADPSGAPPHAEDKEEGGTWFCVARGNKFAYVNAGRTVDVPHATHPDGRFCDLRAWVWRDWLHTWPRAADRRADPHAALAAYLERVGAGEVAPVPARAPVAYVSETALADAVELLL